MLSIKHNSGFSLVEIMIAMVLGVGSLAAVSSLVGYGIGVNSNLLNSARLNEEMGNVFNLMTTDIRRAGFSGSTVATLTDPAANPSAFAGSIAVSAYPGEAANSCITYNYDANGNGVIDNASPNENFGFRLRDDAVEIRVGALLCTDTGWRDLTDSEMVDVTNLRFTAVPVVDSGITTTTVTIAFEGELVSNANFSRDFSTTFMVRNYD